MGRYRIDLDIERIAADYAAGAVMAALAARYGVSEPTIRARLLEYGTVPRRPGPARSEPEQMDAIEQDYLKGDGLRVLSGRYGLCSSTLWRHLHRRGVPMRPGGPSRVLPQPWGLRLLYLKHDYTMQEIGNMYGLSRQAVQQALKRGGIQAKCRKKAK